MARDNATWLQRHGLVARTVTIKVRYSDFTTITRSDTRTATNDPEEIAKRAVARNQLAHALKPQLSGEPAGGVPRGGAGPQLSRPSALEIGIFGPAIAAESRATSAIALTRESASRASLLRPW